MNPERKKRRKEVQRALNFIKSALPYPDPNAYESFLVQLVCDLLDEGNASFRDGDWTDAKVFFTEGVNVAIYARGEHMNVPVALLESLYINRAAVYQNMGEFKNGVDDCNLALDVCKNSPKALYRKAVCLKSSGRLNEAYECSTKCLLTSPQDQTLSNLVQEISVSLGLKNRKAYNPHISADKLKNITELSRNLPENHLKESLNNDEDDDDVMGDELDNLLDCVSREEETTAQSVVVPSHLLPFTSPSPHLPPVFYSSSESQLNVLDSFSKADLDSDWSCDVLDALDAISPPAVSDSPQRPLLVGGDALDTLSEFTLPDGKVCGGFLPSVNLLNRQDHLNTSHTRNGDVSFKNPLEQTHDFIQACNTCFTSTGSGVLDFEFKSDLAHSCKKDLLLCRRKGGANSPWRRIRPRPTHKNFMAAFMLCREVSENQVCKYGENCNFAYCQEEIDVWTQERRGLLVRDLLFSPQPTNEKSALSVIKLLNIHTGMFMFLCEICFDCEPRIISKRRKDNPALCANTQTQHQFDKTKCLVHVVKNTTVHYTKIRKLTSRCQFAICHQELGLSCKRKHNCCFSHSIIELHTWILQRETGISADEIVHESIKHWNKHRKISSPKKRTADKCKSPTKVEETNARAGPVEETGSDACTEPQMKFVCGQCWRDGLLSEPDQHLKYCNAKARHSWTKERRILLVKSHEKKKWVTVRSLPLAKSFPQQYDICANVLKQRRCRYIGNCTFAHSEEEKDFWTYMKNNNLKDIQQVYDFWLSTTNQNRPSDPTSPSQPIEEKQIIMPTDFAEDALESFYCVLCGKHSNSERQWFHHITSEKHKLRVLSGEGEDENLLWSYRFPGPAFSLCHRLEEGCPDGVSCDFAHSDEELHEWRRRREFLRRRLNKAREDMMISPDDNDFGNYNFLLQD